MSQPTAFARLVDYTDDATNSVAGRATVRPDKLDAEMDALVTTIGQILTNLALNQRDDGNIRDGRVKLYTLAPDVRALITAAGATFNAAGIDWLTSTAYAVSNIIQKDGATYLCATAHTSGTFATDLAADKWILISLAASAFAASGVSVTPAGSIASTDVQAALEELDSEKMAKASNLSDVADAATARTNLAVLGTAGGTMTGKITLDGNPSSALHAAPKQYVDAIRNGMDAGQCVLTYVSATGIRLDPDNGNQLFINGTWYTIAAAGVSLTNSGLSANTTYNIYAYNNGGSVALEASTTARATDSTYGHQIKNGDATRTLVGKVRTNASSQFQSGRGLVISWFNRRTKRATAAFSANRTTTSLSATEVNSEIRAEFLTWGDDDVLLQITGAALNGTGGQATITFIGIDGVSSRSNGCPVNSTSLTPISCAECVTGLAEGYHYATLAGFVTGGTATWSGSTAPYECRLTAVFRG